VNTIQTRHKVFPILGEASASSLSNESVQEVFFAAVVCVLPNFAAL